jgi:predicted phosphodiesterase
MIEAAQPKLFICGHSHILKVIHDSKYQLLHINPGAAGNYGFHLMRTIVRFSLHEGKIQDMEVIELGKKTLGNI